MHNAIIIIFLLVLGIYLIYGKLNKQDKENESKCCVWPLYADSSYDDIVEAKNANNGTVFVGNWSEDKKKWARDILDN